MRHEHQSGVQAASPSVRYAPNDEVDFAIVGSGAAGGVVARELSRAGFKVVVLEQGPYIHEKDFRHDELAIQQSALTNNYEKQPNTFRKTESEKARVQPALVYGNCVGGSSVHFTANYWRFHEIDFIERSKKGPLAGTSMEDWPITYADLEPYYTMVEWECGVSGQAGASPFDPPRSKPYPLPPLPIQPHGVLLERGAKKLGMHAFPAPMAILSQPYRGRSGCVRCGFCETFGCEVRAKSSTLASMIPEAEATGKCEIRPLSYVRKVQLDVRGRVTGVVYFDKDKREVMQRAKAVVLCANGAETPRLLLMSKSKSFPDGLANSSGVVGRNLMFNSGAAGNGKFAHEVNGYRGVVVSRVVHDTYELDPKLGLYGGGGFDFRFDFMPIAFASNLPPDAPKWGSEFKQMLRDYYTRTVMCFGHATSLPVPTNRIDLDPDTKDAWGLPAIRMTYQDHENDLKLSKYFQDRAVDLLNAAGAERVWRGWPVESQQFGVHLLGTCRMGNDKRTSVVDKFHRTHDVRNLFIVDGSSLVTSGRGQPTMTIQALAFRAGDYMARAAKAGDI